MSSCPTGTEDFYFEADGKPLTGLDNWKVVNVKIIEGENKGSGALVTLEKPDIKLRIIITYMLYPGLPLIRKKDLISKHRQAGDKA